ncbi:TetR/AcrR family transcriptional regulator [Christensenellaceae bacterium OttesenSCG-928-M15]|nr:TetR/AcrR family transcriptional regulator [Christensenellaceae bacterium OttesenSCG-928-M15]
MKKTDASKRIQIIHVAIELFRAQGFDATAVQDITKAANIAKGTMYLYFKSKEDLIEQVFDYCHDRDVACCDMGLEEEATAIDKLCKRMDNAINWAITHENEATVERMYLHYPKKREGVGIRYVEQKHFHSVDPIIRAGIASGELKKLPSALLGEVFFGIAAAYYYYAQSNPEQINNEEIWALCRQTVKDCLENSEK